MKRKYELWVPGRPRAKARPRLGRGRRAYTPSSTLEAEEVLAKCWEAAYGEQISGPLEVELQYSRDGTRVILKPLDATWYSPLGDIDNLAKLTMDGLQGVAFEDDRQVMRLKAMKMPEERR